MNKAKLDELINYVINSNMADRDKVATIKSYTENYNYHKRIRSARAKAAYRAKVAKRPK